MDKRTLLFILCIAATFFFVNYYFSEQREKKQSELIKQQEIQKAKQFEQDAANGYKRIADVSALPLVEIYQDAEGKQFLSNGIQSNGAILTLSSEEAFPQTVYFRNYGSDSALASLTRLSESTQNSPAIYGTDKQAKLAVGIPPSSGSHDIQVIEMGSGAAKPVVFLGEYKNGQFKIPFASPKKMSIALFKTPKGYLPAGIFDPYNQVITFLNAYPALASNIVVESAPAAKSAPASEKVPEAFYVLENEYMQLVFSNHGGALAEINLPFETSQNQQSVVREIGFDRFMQKDYPYNDHFPSKPYFTPQQSEKGRYTLNENSATGGFYPLIRRNLISSEKGTTLSIPPRFYSLNIVSDYPEVAELVYEVKEFDKTHIVFEAVQSLRRITKTFSLVESPTSDPESKIQAPYVLTLSIKVDGDSRGLYLTSGIPEVELISGAAAPSLKYRIVRKGKSEVQQIDLPSEKEIVTVTSTSPDWISNSNGYLGLIMDPLTEIGAGYKVQYVPGTAAPTRLVLIDQEYQRYKASEYPGYNILLPLNHTGGEMDFRVFAGPYEDNILKKVDAYFSNPSTGYNPDYVASQSFHGWFSFISEPFAKFLYILMNFFHSVTGSWAFSIILLTVALRIMLYPLNAWSFRSMRRMQEIAPDVAAIQAKYKKDQRKAQIEIMNLYREKKVNPFTGCFPILIQMPFLIGMFDLLKSTFALRGASFIPGWIDNLTAPDVLFSWSYPIFFIGTEFHLLPILLGFVMFLQQKMSSTAPKDKNLLTDQQKQQKMMGNIMVIVFAVMFYHFPSGLNIYWLSSMLLGILQQWFTNRQLAKAKAKTAA